MFHKQLAPTFSKQQVIQVFDQRVRNLLIQNYESQYYCKLQNVSQSQLRQLILLGSVQTEDKPQQQLFKTESNQVLSDKLLNYQAQEADGKALLSQKLLKSFRAKLGNRITSAKN